MFSEEDVKQFRSKGIPLSTIDKQIENFIHGFPTIRLTRPAVKGDGIFSFCDDEITYFINYFKNHLEKSRVVKFVPASGAASRMFKHLFEFRESFGGKKKEIEQYLQDADFNSVHYLISHLPEIAFYRKLTHILSAHRLTYKQLTESWNLNELLNYILDEKGLNYSALPKGLLQFHDYPEGARTSAEEHLVEAAHYAKSQDGISRIHFTISPEHRAKFDELFRAEKATYEQLFGVSYEIEFSEQMPSTDTIAVDESNQPFRTADGAILFRPGGHGSLLLNLSRIAGDIIFIKNIDNIIPDRLKSQTYRYKRLIGGYLLYIRDKIHQFLREAEGQFISDEKLQEMIRFASDHLFMIFPDNFARLSPEARQTFLVDRLNRPIRVCGMVKNEGEPGGGPFWVQNGGEGVSLQIIESSQIDLTDPVQKDIVNRSTHFNPVDLVCSVKNYRGEPFDLAEFVDEKTGFISLKSTGGKTLKAQELPGLWNGAMARWITVFVEVPIITFNPVKTVNDLLRIEHLAE
ncbi:MAG: DUF4301 family protein [bacterium]